MLNAPPDFFYDPDKKKGGHKSDLLRKNSFYYAPKVATITALMV